MTDDGVVFAYAANLQKKQLKHLFFSAGLTLQSRQERKTRCLKCLLVALLFISLESAC